MKKCEQAGIPEKPEIMAKTEKNICVMGKVEVLPYIYLVTTHFKLAKNEIEELVK